MQLFIDNEWVDAKKGEKMPVIDPRTGDTVFEVAKASEEDVDAAVKAARKAFDEGPWPKMGGKVKPCTYFAIRVVCSGAACLSLFTEHELEGSRMAWIWRAPHEQQICTTICHGQELFPEHMAI